MQTFLLAFLVTISVSNNVFSSIEPHEFRALLKKDNNAMVVKKIIDQLQDINHISYKSGMYGICPLATAAQYGKVEIVDYLLSQPGIEIDRFLCRSSVAKAVISGNKELVQKLIDAGGEITPHQAKLNESGLAVAIVKEDIPMIELLIANDALLNSWTEVGNSKERISNLTTALTIKRIRDDNQDIFIDNFNFEKRKEIFKLLVASGANPEAESAKGTIFHEVVDMGTYGERLEVLNLIKDHAPNIMIDQLNQNGETALYRAIIREKYQWIRPLLEAGAYANKNNSGNRTVTRFIHKELRNKLRSDESKRVLREALDTIIDFHTN